MPKTSAKQLVALLISESRLVAQRVQHALSRQMAVRLLGVARSCSELQPQDAALVDLCLLDLQMPDAPAHLTRIRSSFPEKWCLLLAPGDSEEESAELLMGGADGCLPIPEIDSGLAAAIAELPAGGTPLPPKVASRLLHAARHSHPPDANCKKLSRRELEVVQLLAQGITYKAIADGLTISIDTVRRHISNIYSKLHVNSRTEAVLLCLHMLRK